MTDENGTAAAPRSSHGRTVFAWLIEHGGTPAYKPAYLVSFRDGVAVWDDNPNKAARYPTEDAAGSMRDLVTRDSKSLPANGAHRVAEHGFDSESTIAARAEPAVPDIGAGTVELLQQLSDAEPFKLLELEFKRLCAKLGTSRELSLAITNVEQAVNWVARHITKG